jgi:hypothetical protein
MLKEFTCYADESGTDNNLPMAVVGGLLLDHSSYFWLDVAWNKTLARHGITPPVHMRKRQRFLSETELRAPFGDLVHVVNEHKLYSVAATLSADQYRTAFDGVSELSMYGACFGQLVMINDVLAPKTKGDFSISYMMDDETPKKRDVEEAYPLMMSVKTMGKLDFGKDNSISALQAADLIAWSIRRRISGTFSLGYEPLTDLFGEDHHIDIEI